jgi:hypothetical protein
MKTLQGNGFELRISGRAGLVYTERGRSMEVDSEMLVGPFDIAVYRASIGLWSDGEVGRRQRES